MNACSLLHTLHELHDYIIHSALSIEKSIHNYLPQSYC